MLSVGGIGASPTLDDVCAVSLGELGVALDPAGAERLKKASPAPKSFQLEDPSVTADLSSSRQEQLRQQGYSGLPPGSDLLPPTHTRAVLVTKLLQLMNGARSGVRLQVAEFIAALLNNGAGVLPQLGWAEMDGQAPCLPQLTQACYGLDLHSGPSGTPPPDAAAMGMEPPKLSPAERLVLLGGAAASAGVGALVVQGSKKLFGMAKANAALSMEAIGMQV